MLEDLGFVLYCENIWFRYKEINFSNTPHFVLTTTISPERHTFIVKNLFENETFSTNSKEGIKQFIIKGEREEKLKKILD